MGKYVAPLEERFNAKVLRTSNDTCWKWTGAHGKDGRGVIVYNGRPIPAARASLILSGVDIPPGMWVLHRCDNPNCVNPKHLFLGTARDNMRDAVAKGRHTNKPKGKPIQRIGAWYTVYYIERDELIYVDTLKRVSELVGLTPSSVKTYLSRRMNDIPRQAIHPDTKKVELVTFSAVDMTEPLPDSLKELITARA